LDVPEGLNVEVAHKLSEQEEAEERRKQRWEEIAEVIEVLILAIAAIATAWSGFQASEWDGRQSLSYGQSTTQRFLASDASTRGGQQLVADSAMFTGWLRPAPPATLSWKGLSSPGSPPTTEKPSMSG
jgi:hypothetical protein